MKLNLLFDATVIINTLEKSSGRTGIYFVAYNILRLLLEDKNTIVFLYCETVNLEKLKKSYSVLFEQREVEIFTDKSDFSRINAYFSPIFKIPDIIKDQIHIIKYTMIYDVSLLLFPDYFINQRQDWFFDLIDSINKNDFYFSISEYTKNDFIKYIPGIDKDKITTVTLAANEHFYKNNKKEIIINIKKKYNIPMDYKYLFSLCSLEPRKNIIMAINAFIKFVNKNKINDIIYVLGGTAWGGFIAKLEKEIDNFEKYRHLIVVAGYIDDLDLSSLYSNAEWFVYTSEFEGFGLPPLEAMKCGCPVITSNNSSLPEVVGSAGIMIDFNSMEQHIDSYEKYYFNKELRKLNAKKGYERAKLFSWDKSVGTILNKINNLEKQRHREPLVTIVTITFNLIKAGREKYFVQCLESVKNQTYKNIEHIIIDGASTDGTLSLIKKYEIKGWVICYSESDNGVYDAMNKGIAKAKGKYIIFLNSDDFFHEEKGLEYSIMKLEEQQADYCFSNAAVLREEDDKKVSDWIGNINMLPFAAHYCHQTMLVKTDVMKEIKGFDLGYRVSADSDLKIRLYAQNRKHVHLNYCFVSYRLGGFSGDQEQSRKDHSNSFYKWIGQSLGLTVYDCYLLWQWKFFSELDLNHSIKLISKLQKNFWIEPLLVELVSRVRLENIRKNQAVDSGILSLPKRIFRKFVVELVIFIVGNNFLFKQSQEIRKRFPTIHSKLKSIIYH